MSAPKTTHKAKAPRELADARCAWRKMTTEMRAEFLTFAFDESPEDVNAWLALKLDEAADDLAGGLSEQAALDHDAENAMGGG